MNKVILIGHVGKEPEIKDFNDGGSVANFTLATSDRGYKKADGTEVPEKTEWHNITTNNKGLCKLAMYISKGDTVSVEGKIRQRSYELNGQKRYVTEVVASAIEIVHSKSAGNAPQEQSKPQQPNVTGDLPF